MAPVLAGMLVLDGGPVRAQDLDAGKSGQRLFAANCASCHRTPRGLAKGRNRFSLFYFMRQHYTASQTSAADLTAYILAAGEAPRAGGKSTSRRPRQ